MDGDRAKIRSDDDRLGFTPIAEHLARVLVDQSVVDGLVLGIEGKWGSGKSTLINLTIEALDKHRTGAPEIIAFSPWLVGDRDSLISNLFDELATAAAKIDPIEHSESSEDVEDTRILQRFLKFFKRDEHWKLRKREKLKEHLRNKLEAFGTIAGTLGKLSNAAGAAGVPGGKLAGSALTKSGDAARSVFSGRPISKLKTELVASLRLLSRRIVVFVDDLDRLEPREASEVLRLIRAVADFPNVIYVLSYDPDVVAQTLTKAIQVDDGMAFLEKIVQVSFKVPQPEAFDLRRWFQSELNVLFPEEREENNPDYSSEVRLSHAIDTYGGRYFQTPRDVVRSLNALCLHAVPVKDHTNLADMVWLQIVRIGNPLLYLWIEEYVTEVAAVANRAMLSDETARIMDTRLRNLLQQEALDVHRAAIELAHFLPGISWPMRVGDDEQGRLVFNNLDVQTLDRFVAEKRLGSSQHYRYYFAFTLPAGALPDEQAQAFVTLSENDAAGAVVAFKELCEIERPQGGTMAEALLDRIGAWIEDIPEAAIPGIFAAMAEVMDDIALATRDGDFGQHRAWPAAVRVTGELLRRTTGEIRSSSISALFRDGRALGWLTSILRDEIFAHGRYGNHEQPENQWLLSADEFDDVLTAMLNRFREMPAAELSKVPNLLGLLYGWQQGSGTDEPKDWVANQIQDDAGLLEFLSRSRGWSSASGRGVYYPLKRRELDNFLSYDDSISRLNAIVSSGVTAEADRRLAEELLGAAQDGEDH